MGLDDAIDRAIDAAEAKIASGDVGESVETQDVVEEQNLEAESSSSDLVEEPTLSTKNKVAKDSKGRFTKSSDSAEKEEAKEEASETDFDQVADDENKEATAQEVDEPIQDPPFWSAEDKPLLVGASKELRKAILKYETNRQQFVSRLASETERGRQIESRAQEVFKPYETKLKASGIKDPWVVVDRMLAWDDLISQDPKTAAWDILQKGGLTPYDLIQDADAQAQQQPNYNDPRIDQFIREAKEAKELAAKANEQIQSHYQQQQLQAAYAQLNSWKQGQDSAGRSRGQVFDLYQPQIVNAAQEIKKYRPEMSDLDAIDHAYEFILGEAQKTLGFKPVSQQPKATVDVNRAKAAMSINGSPRSGIAPQRQKAKSIDEAMDRAEAALGIR